MCFLISKHEGLFVVVVTFFFLVTNSSFNCIGIRQHYVPYDFILYIC